MRIGVDLGGTKIEVMALAADGRELLRERRPTPRDDYAGTVEAIVGLVIEVEARLREPGTVGICHPGAISPATGLVKNANSTWLNGRPLDRDLPERARAAGALRQRRQLLRAVRGDRRRRARARRWCSA